MCYAKSSTKENVASHLSCITSSGKWCWNCCVRTPSEIHWTLIKNFFDTVAALNGVSRRLLTSNPYMVPIATFVIETDTAMKQEISIAFATKGMMDAVEMNEEVDDSPPSSSDSWTREPHHKKSLIGWSQCCYCKRGERSKGRYATFEFVEIVQGNILRPNGIGVGGGVSLDS